MLFTDQQVYQLVHTTIRPRLEAIMNGYNLDRGTREDALSEFCLFLRDGYHPESKRSPYEALENIRNERAIGEWITTTFSHWLQRWQAKIPPKASDPELIRKQTPDNEDTTSHIFTETELTKAIELIERINETFPAADRYIIFTDMLALHSGRKSTKEEAIILGTTENNIRVRRNRLQERIKKLRVRLSHK